MVRGLLSDIPISKWTIRGQMGPKNIRMTTSHVLIVDLELFSNIYMQLNLSPNLSNVA